MIYNDDLMRLRDQEVSALRLEVDRLNKKIEFLEAQLEVSKEVMFNK